MAITLKITGTAKVRRFINRVKKAVTRNTNMSINDAGVKLKDEVKASIAGQRAEPRSVDTGAFLSSVTAKGSNKMTSQVSSGVGYDKYLEFGTSRIQARPHFRHSATRMKSKIKKMVVDGVQKATQ